MKAKTFTFLLFLFFITSVQAQLPNGSIAPNITFTDIDGNTHTLYDILDEGKSVVFDVMATWCGPCWSYHNTHILRDLYNEYGPNGTNDIEVFMIESSTSTNEACLYGPAGCSGGTYGDWTDDTPYRIVHITSNNGGSFNADFAINYFPTLYKICPNRKIYEVGQASLSTWETWVSSCNLDANAIVNDGVCFGEQTMGVDLTTEGGHGVVTYSWSNGSTTEDLNGVPPGTYSCTITEGNNHSIEIGPYQVDGPSSPLILNIVDQNNVNCFGEANGSVSTTTSGGGTNYTYMWNNGATTSNLNNVSGGIYTLTVTDSYGCTETQTAVISEPPLLNLNATPVDENCGQEDGILLLFASGGEGSFLYDIGDGPTPSNVFNDLAAGSYSATVTDANGCTSISNAVIENIPGPEAVAGEDENINCNENSIVLDGSGSSSGNDISYLWETNDGNIVDGANTLTPEIDQPGTYTLTVIDTESGCQSTDEVLVEGDLDAPESNAGEDELLTCTVEIITLTGTGSSEGPEITYSWLNSNGDEIATSLEVDVDLPDTYELVVTNTENGCTASSTVEVTEDIDTPVSNAGEGEELTCTVNEVTLDGSGSSSGNEMTYQWLNSNGDEIATSVEVDVDLPDTYELVVTNTANGCTSSSTVEVSEDVEAPVSNAGEGEELTCEVNEVTLDGSGSSSGNEITYQWLNSNGDEIATSLEVDVDLPDTYELIVTNTANGCTSSSTVEVSEDVEAPVSNAGEEDELTCVVNEVTLDGSGSSSGSEMTYQWLNSNGDEIATTLEVDVDLPDTYELVVTNTANGCTSSSTVEVSEDVEAPVSNAGEEDELTCVVNEVTLDGSGSSSGNEMTYQWLNSNGDEIATTLEVDVNLPDTYELVVTNTANGCTSSSTVEVSEDVEAPVSNAGEEEELTCTVNEVTLDGSGSSSGIDITYSWLNSNGDEIATSVEVDVDLPDTYELVVTNTANGCTSSSTVEVSEDVEAPVSNAGEGEELTCEVNEVTLDGSGSSSGNEMAYSWLNSNGDEIATSLEVDVDLPDTYELIVTNTANGCTSSSTVEVSEDVEAPLANAGSGDLITCINTSASLDGSESSGSMAYQWYNAFGELISEEMTTETTEAGNYLLVVTNPENGCTATDIVTVSIDVESPLANAGNDEELNCDASSVVLDGSGSSTGSIFEYTWLNSNSVNIGNTITVEVSSAEVFELVVTNTENGCTATSQVEVTASNDFPTVEVNAEGQLNCINNSVLIDGTGSSEGSNFSYQWEDEDGNFLGDEILLDVNTPGTYVFVVTDASNGCSASSNVIIIEDVLPPLAEIETPEILDCSNTEVQLSTINNSNVDLSFQWFDNAGNTIGEGPTVNVDEVGEYSVMVTNLANGCTANASTQVEASTDLPIAEAAVNGILHCNQTELTIDANGSSNGVAFDYSWTTDNGNILGDATIQNPTINAPGVYTLVVTNTENGCSSATSVEVNQSTDPILSIDQINSVTCFGGTDGEITLSVQGTGPFTYDWSNGATNGIDLSAGDYTVIVTDAYGCQDQIEATVVQPDEIIIELQTVNNNVCANDSQGSIDIEVSGGTGGYSYNWSNGMTEADIDNLTSGTYTLEVTDQEGCVKNIEVMITASDTEFPTLLTQDIVLSLDENGTASFTAEMLDNGSYDNCGIQSVNLDVTSFDCSNIGANQVQFSATDVSGNTASTFATVTVIDEIAPVLTCVGNIVSNNCQSVEYELPQAADNCGTMDVVLVDGLASGEQFPIGTTTVVYEVSDLSGNSTQCSFTITVENTLDAELTAESISCFGVADGRLTALASGGTPGYSYEWSTGETTPEIENLGAGDYSVIVTDAAGCQFEETFTLNQPEVLEIFVDQITDEIGTNANGSIEVSIAGGTSGYSFEWTDSNGDVIATTEDLTDVPAGEYTLTVIDANGCIAFTEPIVVDSIVSTTQLDFEKNIRINPNPTPGNVTVQIELDEAMDLQLSVLDVTGRVLIEKEQEYISTKVYDMDLAHLPNGVYLARLILDGQVYVSKIVLSKR